MKTNVEYQLSVGDAAAEHLDSLDFIFGANTRSFLSSLNIQKGMHVTDIGCGSGNVACWLAEQVGPEGLVYAVDQSAEQLELTQQRIKSRGLNNIQTVQASIYDVEEKLPAVDLAYCRHVIVHTQEPMQALQAMAKLVKTGGLMVCEEGSHETAFCYPNNRAYESIFRVSGELLSNKGFDPQIGKHIYALCSKLENFEFNLQLSHRVMSKKAEVNQMVDAICNMTRVLADSLHDAKLLTTEQTQLFLQELASIKDIDNVIIAPAQVTQIWGRKH